MARSSYYVEIHAGRRAHAVSAERWKAYVALGLLVVVEGARRLARLRDSGVQARFVEGELQLFDVGAKVKTNAEVIDQLWKLADAGAVSRSVAEQRAILAIRASFGEDLNQREKYDKPETRAAIDDYMADQRKRRIQDELIRSRRTQIVVGRDLVGASGELREKLAVVG